MGYQKEHIIKLEDLTIGYKKGKSVTLLLKGLNIGVYSSELVAVIGRNGTGKSTLLRTLCGLQDPLSGQVFISDIPVKKFTINARARKMAYVSTENIHAGHMKVKDLVALGRTPYTGWFGNLSLSDKMVIMDAIDSVGLTGKQDDFIDEISDGERQRTMIARALSQNTELIYLDEPTAFLDINNRFEIFNLLYNLTRVKGKTIIFSTHDLQVALSESDRLWLIEDENIYHGAPEDLILSGKLSAMFDGNHVLFNIENGGFTVKKKYKDSVTIKGKESLEKKWTVSALERLGYKVEKNKEKYPSIVVKESGDKTTWILQKKSETIELKNIYELSLHLRNLFN